MLQWMGGSRRKVAASHTSVKKRQKQYFEQRRRQQQQLTVGSENCTEEIEKSGPCQREHRSLDILSLVNLSTAVPGCKSSCPKDRTEDLDADASSLNYNILRGSSTIPGGTYIASPSEIKGAGSSSSYKEESLTGNKTSFSLSDNQINSSSRMKNREDLLMESAEEKLSVFDLVGGDDLSVNLEEDPACESHVAFSIEGLGKINTETPPYSPQRPERIYASWCSPPWKITSRPESSNIRYKHSDLENEVDAFLESNYMSKADSPFGFSTGAAKATECTRKQKFCAARDYVQMPSCTGDSGSSFHDILEFNISRAHNEYEWDARSLFLGDGEDSMHWKDQQLYETESGKADFLKDGNGHVPGCTSGGHVRMKKRDYMEATARSNIPDSPGDRLQILERNDEHPSFSNTTHFNPGKMFDTGEVTDYPGWSSFVAEEENDTLSMLSEESCSSSAAWASENDRPRRKDLDSFCSAGDQNCLNNSFGEELWEDGDGSQQEKRKQGSGKYARLLNLGKSKSNGHRYSSSLHGGLEVPYNRSVEGFMSADMNSGLSSFPKTSKMTLSSSCSEPWCRDPSGASLDFPLSKSSFVKPKHSESVEHPLLSSFMPKKLEFSCPSLLTDSHDSIPVSGITPERAKPHVFLDPEFDGMHPGSSTIAGSTRGTCVPKFSAPGGSGNDEYGDANGFLAKVKLGVGGGICDWDSDRQSAKGREIDAIKCIDEDVRSPKTMEERAEETSSSVKISENSKSHSDENECKYNGEVSEGRHKRNAGPEDIKSDGATGRKTSGDSSQQTIMLKRHVLQLVCFEKALLLDTLKT